MTGRFAGVDVTQSFIEVAVRPTGEVWTANSDESGITEIADKLEYIGPELVVLEASGRFELPVAGTLATAGLPFALVPPRSVREFARAIGRMTRMDKSQAGLLAHFAELVRPEPRPLSEEVIQQLKDIRTRRGQVLEILVLERGRLHTAPTVLQRDIQNHLQFLERNISNLEDQLNRTIRYSPIWR